MSGGDPSVGAFVVTWNRPEARRRFARDPASPVVPPDAIFVVDNGDGEAALEVTRDVGNGITYRRTGGNLGSAGGVAFGRRWLAELGFEWMLVNDDTTGCGLTTYSAGCEC